MSDTNLLSSSENIGHQKKSAATRKAKDPEAFRKMGRKGAKARHAKPASEESAIAKRAAARRKERDPDTFRKMGSAGGKAPHVTRGRNRIKDDRASRFAISRVNNTEDANITMKNVRPRNDASNVHLSSSSHHDHGNKKIINDRFRRDDE